jgi:hypothetical protein
MARTFAPRSKNREAKKAQKIFESLEVITRRTLIYQGYTVR